MVFNWMLLLIPVSLSQYYFFHLGPIWTFAATILAIVPLAEWIRRATEQLAHRAGSSIGGLLNVTFGNTPELVLALFVLANGKPDVVKAQITGSIIGNSLLGLGLAIVVGCWGRQHLTFKRERAGLLSSLLVLVTIALLLPAIFDYAERVVIGSSDYRRIDERLSLGVSVILIGVYFANLAYTFLTHRDVFAMDGGGDDPPLQDLWPVWKSVSILLVATIFTAWESELISSSLEASAAQLGLSTLFLGIVVLAVVGNAAEYVSAIYFARKGQMGLVMSITVGSTIQVALLLAPLLVLISFFTGHPMNLVFENPLELIAISAVAFVVNAIASDGEATWFEGVLLLAVYMIFGMAFLFVGN